MKEKAAGSWTGEPLIAPPSSRPAIRDKNSKMRTQRALKFVGLL